MKTCGVGCSREKYVEEEKRMCLDVCGKGYWVGENMRCMKWGQV